MKSISKSQTGLEYLIVIGGIIILSAASYFIIKSFSETSSSGTTGDMGSVFDVYTSELEEIAGEAEPAIFFSGPLNMNGSGIYNVSEIEVGTVNTSELTIHNELTNALIESIGGSPLIIRSALYMLVEAVGNLILNPSGNVGIKTSSPSTELDVNGTITATALATESVNDNVYYCSTLAEINAALTAIGSGGGTIVLESGTIPLSSAIQISGGGSYIIKGQGVETVLQPDGNKRSFSITNAAHFVIEDLKIDMQNLVGSTEAIFINSNNNRGIIRNVHFMGDGASNAWGVEVDSDYVTVEHCHFEGIWRGIHVDGNRAKILHNLLYNLSASDGTTGVTGSACYGINIAGNESSIVGNILDTIISGSGGSGANGGGADGIRIFGDRNSVEGNIVKRVMSGDGGTSGIGGGVTGIRCSGKECRIIGNTVVDIIGGSGGAGSSGSGGRGGDSYGIILAGSDDTSVSDNYVHNVFGGAGGNGDNGDGGESGNAYGIRPNGLNVNVIGNEVDTVISGEGGNATVSGVGGQGDNAFGIWGSSVNHVSIVGNTIHDVRIGDSGVSVGTGNSGRSASWAAGIYVTSLYCKINDNSISHITGGRGGNLSDGDSGGAQENDDGGDGAGAYGIFYQTNEYGTCTGNIIQSITGGDGADGGVTGGTGGDSGGAKGIYYSDSGKGTISDNVIRNLTSGNAGTGSSLGNPGWLQCIHIYNSPSCVMSGNYCQGQTLNDGARITCIYISHTNSDTCVVTGNSCNNFVNTGTGDGYGIHVAADVDETTVVGNSCIGNDNNFVDQGVSTFGNATLNNFE